MPNIWEYKSLSRILRKVIYPLDQGKSLLKPDQHLPQKMNFKRWGEFQTMG
jgi:hypothetical protein